MVAYKKVNDEIVEALKQMVGEKYVIYADPDRLESYATDEVADEEYHHLPEVVVIPRTTSEISAIMKLANRENIPVTPRGAGSGLSGGAIPIFGGIVLSIERMNSILEVDLENMVIEVEPGVVTNEINTRIKEQGLFYAGYPMSVESCYVAGNVAENAGGGKAVKYGVTSRYVLGLEVVLPSGEIIELGGKLVKDVVGYNLTQLMVGSEGTLGIFTKIILKLIPLPTEKVDLLVLFPDAQTAMQMVPRIMTIGRITPTAIEFMDQLSVQTTCKYLNENLPYENAGAMLLIEVDGNSEQDVLYQYETIGNLCYENNAIEVYVADNQTTQERVWAVRRNIAEAFKVYSPIQSLEDIVLPIANIPKIIPILDRFAREYAVIIPCYGHAGDGNLHVTIVKRPDLPMEKWKEEEHKVLTELYHEVAALNGTISGEHGIGIKRRNYLNIVLGEEVIRLQKQIKAVFDPNQILNPGKIFPDTVNESAKA
ncbi:MAG: FAD-binding oxidoreductase [Chloroflexi bacterium HGW-Chloroflexi-10]|nr:MAG: FAD-binding oxidoreductase [Chloroflexi bacterium HGW-Chloroflexi-10]